MVAGFPPGAWGSPPPRRPDQRERPRRVPMLPPPGPGTVPRLIVTGGAPPAQGLYLYNPSVGSGNLVASGAAQAGTDLAGNTVVGSGWAAYGTGADPQYALLGGGALTMGDVAGTLFSNVADLAIFQQGLGLAPYTRLRSPSQATPTQLGLLLYGANNLGTRNPMAFIAPFGNTPITNSMLEVQGGHIAISTPGRGLHIAQGTNAKIGTATLVAGTVTVADTSVTANSVIVCGYTTGAVAANAGAVFCSSATAGTGFTLKSTNAADTSVVGYCIIEQI